VNTIRVISRSEIERHLGMADAVKAVQEAYVLNSEKEIILFDTVFHDFEAGKADMDITSRVAHIFVHIGQKRDHIMAHFRLNLQHPLGIELRLRFNFCHSVLGNIA